VRLRPAKAKFQVISVIEYYKPGGGCLRGRRLSAGVKRGAGIAIGVKLANLPDLRGADIGLTAEKRRRGVRVYAVLDLDLDTDSLSIILSGLWYTLLVYRRL